MRYYIKLLFWQLIIIYYSHVCRVMTRWCVFTRLLARDQAFIRYLNNSFFLFYPFSPTTFLAVSQLVSYLFTTTKEIHNLFPVVIFLLLSYILYIYMFQKKFATCFWRLFFFFTTQKEIHNLPLTVIFLFLPIKKKFSRQFFLFTATKEIQLCLLFVNAMHLESSLIPANLMKNLINRANLANLVNLTKIKEKK